MGSHIAARVDRIGVVVPVHNEQDTLRDCLHALGIAAGLVVVPVTIVVVLDACTDGSAAVVDQFASQRVRRVVLNVRCVGAARAAGMTALLERHGPAGTWLATTDADSVVPPHWLSTQLRHAASGARVVAGTVAVEDWQDPSGTLAERASRDYLAKPHRHIHGANLSFAAQTYCAAGGFQPVRYDEDVQLVEAFNAGGAPIAWAVDLAVTTSARRRGRAPKGFAGYLSALETSLEGSVGG
ncbi:glycosyltransferase family A protein [soil metagenome]